jgi:protein involved in polysaccharide export with SLBB domain
VHYPSGVMVARSSLLAGIVACVLHATSARAGAPITAGDQIHVVIPDEARTQLTKTVGVDGELDLGALGVVRIGGLEVSDARKRLRKHLSRYLRTAGAAQLQRAQVGKTVMVTGMVDKPGLVQLQPQEGLWVAIQRAGGVSEGASLGDVLVVHEGDRRWVDARSALADSNLESLTVGTGDTVFVPARAGLPRSDDGTSTFLSQAVVDEKVFVLGGVRDPGPFDRSSELDLLSAIALAGGPTSDADLTRVRLLDPDGSRDFDLEARIDGEVAAQKIPSRGSAIVYVPRRDERFADSRLLHAVNVMGAVGDPGRVPISGATRLPDVLALAGGPTPTARIGRIRLVRSLDGGTVATSYDFRKFTRRGGGLSSVRVLPGDDVYVGDRRDTSLTKVVTIVSNISVLAAAVALFVGLGA